MQEQAINNLVTFLEATISIPSNELDKFLSLLTYVEFKKNQKIISSKKICDRVYFLSEGFVKYELNQLNQPKVIHISSSGTFVSDFFSYYSRQPAITDVYAITKSSLLVASRAPLEKLYSENVVWANFGRKIAENAVVHQIVRHIKLQTSSAEERYLETLTSNPDLFKVIKLGDLAQTLGVTQETLSRIRKRIQ